MTKQLTWREAAKLMIEGRTCIDQYGYEWRFDGSFYFVDGDVNDRYGEIQACTFTLKPEPVKYSVDVWLNKSPEPQPNGNTLGPYLFGASNWSSKKVNHFNKKYRITVEEVGE